MPEKSELINYTLRMPEDYRRRLELEASSIGRSLNQQIVRVLEMHFATAGYGSDLITSAGQMFRVIASLAHETGIETVWHFDLENFKTGNTDGRYDIGLEDAFINNLQIKDPVQAAKEVGLAILHLHGRRGRDIRSLSWIQNPSFDGRRVLTDSEIPDDARSLPDFLELLSKGLWQDRYLVPDEQMEAIQILLLTARLQNSEISKSSDNKKGPWVSIGNMHFDGVDRGVYLNALSKMGTLGLLELSEKSISDASVIAYKLSSEANFYLAKIAALAAR